MINAWCNLFEKDSFAIAAPTGRAAHNVCGVTLHSLLHIGTKKISFDLTGTPLRKLQEAFGSIKFLIIDEYSMVGARMLSIIDKG